MIVIANVFAKLRTVKNFVRTLYKECHFRGRVYSQDVKASEILAISPGEHFYHVFPSFFLKLIWKMSLLVLGEMLGVSVNTLTADDKYFVQDCEKLLLAMQMQLSEK